jgi:hypothetical protein
MTDVIIAEQMEPKDSRRMRVDDSFMEAFVEQSKNTALKVEVDHNWYSRVGKRLGEITNVRFDKENGRLIGDMKVYSAADDSPVTPGVGNYLLGMLEESDDAYMLSMNISVSELYTTIDGNRKTVSRSFDYNDWAYKYFVDGEVYSGDVYLELGKIHSVDVVTEGAMTNAMFSDRPHQDVVQELNSIFAQEGMRELLTEHAEDLHIAEVYRTKYKRTVLDKVQSLLGIKDESEVVATLTTERDQARNDAHKQTQRVTELETQLSAMTSERDALLQSSVTRVTELEAQVAELSKTPGAAATTLAGDPPTPEAGYTMEMSPVTQRALKIYQSRL